MRCDFDVFNRKLWDFVKSKLNKKKIGNGNNIDYIEENGEQISNAKDIATAFNKYFSNIGRQLANKINVPNNACLNEINSNSRTIFLKPTNTNEIELTLADMSNKAGGVDGICTKILKRIINYIKKPLANIFNLCILKGIWPKSLKVVEVVPFYKAGNKYQLITDLSL